MIKHWLHLLAHSFGYEGQCGKRCPSCGKGCVLDTRHKGEHLCVNFHGWK